MNEFVFCFVRIVWIGALIVALMLLGLGLVLLLSPALLVTTLRIIGGIVCIGASLILLLRLFI